MTAELTRDQLQAFIASVLESPAIAAAADEQGLPREEAAALVAIYANEALVGFDLIQPVLRTGMRILEVGSGIGVLARFLSDRGVDIVGIEPSASGFGFMTQIGKAVLDVPPARLDLHWLSVGAEALDPSRHGTFDLIYSTNVLEHIADLEEALKGMASVLADGGQMIHLCPNYVVPYEPHFGIPLVPFAPGLTRYLAPKATRRFPGLWESLNFITSRRLKRLANGLGLKIKFDRGVLSEILDRFNTDPIFRARQGRAVALIHKLITATKLAALVRRVPGQWLTPMVVRVERRG